MAALFSLWRNAWGKHAWSRRLLDALSCSTLAFFSQPSPDDGRRPVSRHPAGLCPCLQLDILLKVGEAESI
nr:phage holin family protein [Candidatus Hamiltonella defensa]